MAHEYTLKKHDLVRFREDGLKITYRIGTLKTLGGLQFEYGDFSLLFKKGFMEEIEKLDSLKLSRGISFETEEAQKDAEETILSLASINQFTMNSLVLSNGFLSRLAKKSAYFSSTKEIHLKSMCLVPHTAIQLVKALS